MIPSPYDADMYLEAPNGDGDDIDLGVDGGVFLCAEGEDLGSSKKYEFFPHKVDFHEYGSSSNDSGKSRVSHRT